jgi:ribosomal-protein-alanine N-acetyltransferase
VSFLIRDATELDLDAILQIERTSFEDAWTAGMFHAHLRGSSNVFLVSESIASETHTSSGIVGFAVAHIASDEAEILDIAVLPAHRGKGIGAALLDNAMGRCAMQGATSIFLEVRESNVAARALYASRHFAVAGRRKRYYHSPPEDGLILRANLPVSTGNPADLQ